MDPRAWREGKKIALRTMALKLGCTWSSIRRWENGETEAPNSIVLGYGKASEGEVAGEDFNRVRKRYLRALEGGGKAA